MDFSGIQKKKKDLRLRWHRVFPRPDSETAQLSQRICAHVKASPEFGESRKIAIFYPRKGEIDLTSLWQNAKAVIGFPRVDPAGKRLRFFYVDSLSDLRPGFAGILEPSAEEHSELSHWTDRDLILVPGLFFDRRGGRLGSGLGLYDRFLSDNPARKWGVAPTDQILEDTLAQLGTDVRMDALCTENGILRF